MKKKYDLAHLALKKRPKKSMLMKLPVVLIVICTTVFSASGLSMSKEHNTVTWALQQQKISGTVKDSTTNELLVGVNVVVEGTTTGTVTNIDGKFTVTATQNSVLVFSFVGYNTKKISVGNQSVLEVILVPSVNKLEEVVVVGYGTMKKSDVTGATVHVDEQELREVPSANISQAFQGKAAGLEIQRTGTNPGAGDQIRIRGSRSIFGSNDPLFVVDGTPFDGNLNDLNPDDIASVDILKDASSTAIYGSRGANGVVLITTKKGKAGKSLITYNGYYGWGKVANDYPVLTPEQYIAMRNYTGFNGGYTADELNSMATGQSTNWQKLIYQTSHKTDQNITISGGNEEGSTFSLGGGYYTETAVLPAQDFTRYTLRGSYDSKIGKKIKVGLSTMNAINVSNGSQFVQFGTMFPILSLSPLSPVYKADGTINYLPAGNIDDINGGTFNPILLKHNNNNWVDRVTRSRTFDNLYGEYEFIPGLKYRINLGLTYFREEDDQFKGAYTPNNPDYFRAFQGNTATVNNSESWGYTVENIITYEKTFAQKHKISFTGLFSTQEFHSHNTSVTKDSINADFVQFYNLAASNNTPYPTVSGGESSWALLSYMARILYVFNDKYMITITGRDDGSSRLAAGHKWHQYPAVSVGWNIQKEGFMENIKVITALKLRAGLGQTSNQAINPYSSLGLVSNQNFINTNTSQGAIIRYNYGPSIVTGYGIVNLPNSSLNWEYTKTYNLGLDFGVLNSRISGSAEYYNTTTNGVLYNVTLPASSGIPGQYQTNVGSVRNYGFELSLSSTNVQSKSGFTWNTDFNLFANRNKILSLANKTTQDVANQLFVGQSMNAIFDYKKLGIWQLNEAADAAKYGAVPGMIKLKDFNGDGKITTDDQAIIGSGDANIQGGMTNRFSFKGFDLSFNLYARFGGTLVSQIHQPLAGYLTQYNGSRNQIRVDYWTPTNPTNWFPSIALSSLSTVSTAWTTLGYYDASFVKLRSINLGYTFSNKLLSKIHFKTVRLYATIDNVATLFSPFMKQTGIDPESTAAGNTGVSNPGNIRNNVNGNGMLVVSASTPLSRTLSIGANFSF